MLRQFAFQLLLLLPSGAMAAAPVEARADADERVPLTIEQQQRHYPVFAADLEQLLTQLRVPGRPDAGGLHAHGLTTSELLLTRQTGQRDADCRIEQARLALSITVTTPRWTPGKAVPESLTSEWPRIRRLIEEHEDAHRQNALNAAQWLRAQIVALDGWLPCSQLSAKISRYFAAAETRRSLQDGLLDARAAASGELTRSINRARLKGERPDWMQ